MINPDESTDVALTNLSIKFKTDYENELIKLNKYLKLAKQYIYDNLDKIDNYIINLEDMHDNQLRKICFPYPYKLENNNKSKILWIIIK